MFAKLVLHKSPQGFTALLLLITFLSGVLLFFLGVIGEYVGRIYEESKGRPLYVVSRIVGGSSAYRAILNGNPCGAKPAAGCAPGVLKLGAKHASERMQEREFPRAW
jgi:hypothetical protein